MHSEDSAPRGLVAQYKLTEAQTECAALRAYIAELRAAVGLLATYEPCIDELIVLRGELGWLIQKVKYAADKPLPVSAGR